MSATSNNIISLRRHDLDNLRTFLTGLVVVHHTAVAYGAPGGTPFKSAITRLAFPGAEIPLTISAAFNQSFFMGLFFWISGRMSAQSLERIDRDPNRTRWSFMKSKALRLGLVAVVYSFLVQPFISLIPLKEWTYSSISGQLAGYFSTMRSVRGPVWYTTNLLLMDAITAFVAPAVETPSTADEKTETQIFENSSPKPPSWYTLLAKYGWIGAAVVSFFVRLYYPVGTNLPITALQPAHGAQYVLAYTMGHASWRYGTSFTSPFTLHNTDQEEMDTESGRSLHNKSDSSTRSIITATLVSLTTLPLVWLPYLFRDTAENWVANSLTDVSGGWNYPAVIYAFWNEFSFVLLCPAFVKYFAAWYNKPASSGLFQAKYSYGAFLVHMLVSILPEIAFDRFLGYGGNNDALATNSVWRWLGPSVMTVVVGAVNVYGSFGVAKVCLDMFPSLRRFI